MTTLLTGRPGGLGKRVKTNLFVAHGISRAGLRGRGYHLGVGSLSLSPFVGGRKRERQQNGHAHLE